MKVKQAPADFVVEEVLDLGLAPEGPFAVYRLEKAGIDTLEVVRQIVRAWGVRRGNVAVAGLKDRHAATDQTLTIRHGPARDFAGRGFRVRHVGQAARPADRRALRGNRFRLVLRDLAPAEAERVAARAREAARDGIPNYFDDQRFGSLRGTGGRFVATALLRGDEEEALRLAIACPAREDRGALKGRRRLLQERWGRWAELAAALEPSVEQRICARLARGAPFGEAYRMLDPSLRLLHLGAWQAHVFNEGLRRAAGAGPAHPGVAGPYVFPAGDPGALRAERIPLAETGAEPHPLLDAVLAEEGFDRAALARLPFRRGLRPAVVVPAEVEVGAPAPDELNPGRQALSLAFVLGPASYATMLVKRCTYDIPPRGRAERRRSC
ncbi:MAG: tRNA pseudouridine(13) synthase TruD [Planctomycetota bacterium]